jgi:prepilin-type N-terminal cleavage/methylation domain-containing protein
MNNLRSRAFTLIELLLVIGIIGILAVVFILNLNPSEAQRKARDLQRNKDGLTLQTFLEQWISDGQTVPASWQTSSGLSSTTNQNCASSNWLGVNVCNYLKSVPADPLNGATRSCAGSTTPCDFVYQIRVVGVDYEVRVRQESTGNAAKVANDGGNDAAWLEYTNISGGTPLL